MTEAELPIPELEEVLEKVPAGKRLDIFIRIVDLFGKGSNRYESEQVEIFENVLGRILAGSDSGLRTQMARRLASMETVPPDTIAKLACDDNIAIAEPILLNFANMQEPVLIDVIRTKSQEHRLAIACRRQIKSGVTDALIESRDDVVVRYLAGNKGAAISHTGFQSLVERAKNDGALAEQLKSRRDMPAPLKKALEGT